MCTYGPGKGSGKCAGGEAMSQKRCWAICVAIRVGWGGAIGTTVETVVGRDAASVGVPLPLWVLTLGEVAAVVGTSAASVEVPLSLEVMTADGVDVFDGAIASGACGNVTSVGVATTPGESTLDKVASVGKGACGNTFGVGLPTTLCVSTLDNVATVATGTSGTVA
jgi:hypothetical protein